jgi:ribonuclease R
MGRKNSKKKQHKKKDIISRAIKGVLDITRSGMGFVIVPDMEGDILVRPGDFGTALHGDTVRVRIKPGGGRRLQGEVAEVLVRKRTEFIGQIQLNKGFGFFTPESDKPMPDVFIPQENLNGAKNNDRVVVKLLALWIRKTAMMLL